MDTISRTERELGVDFATLDPDQRLQALRLYADNGQFFISLAMQFGFEMICTGKKLVAQAGPAGDIEAAKEAVQESIEIGCNYHDRVKEQAISLGQALRLVFESAPAGTSKN